MNKLPEGYKEWIPRVSNIVSFIFPFEGDWKQRYLDWLADNVPEGRKRGFSIDEDEYLTEAQDVGTFVHEQMELYILGITIDTANPLYERHIDVIKGWLEYIDQIKEKYTEENGWKLVAEPVLIDVKWRYQWSSDLVLVNDKLKKVIIKDWKTFWIAKARWDLPNLYKKPYDKIKKGALQFSLYAEVYRQRGYEIEGIDLVYLHYTGAYEYSLELYSTDALNKIVEDYEESLLPKPEIIMTKKIELPLEVEILLPTEQFGNVKVRLNLNDVDNGKTDKENIDALILKAKYIRQQTQI